MTAITSHQTSEHVYARDQANIQVGDRHHHHYYTDTTTAVPKPRAQQVLNALFQADPSLDRARLVHVKGDRVPGTCEWVLMDEKLQSLVRGDCSTLWISGGPGLGKTMLSVFLTETLEKHFRNSADVKVVYYFCNYLLRGTRATDILRTLLWQILQEDIEAADSLFERYFSSKEKTSSTLSSFVALWAILEAVLRERWKHQRIIFVLDGLDECDQESVTELSNKFASMPVGQEGNTALQVIIISRDIARLHSLPRIRLDPDHKDNISKDIKTFVTERVASLSFLDGYNESFRTELEKTLGERAEGTFLWIGFAMSELVRKRTCSAVLETARAFPIGLYAFYSRMLRQVDEQRRATVARVLQWLALARRNIWLTELAVLVNATAEQCLTEEQAARDVVKECGPMLRLTTEKYYVESHRNTRALAERTVVVLVHQSARDYLLRAQPDSDIVAEAFRVIPNEAHLEITRACLACLRTKGENHDERQRQSRLINYALPYWKDHAAFIPHTERSLWRSQEFHPDYRTRHRSRQLRGSELASKYRILVSPLHEAIMTGTTSWVAAILEDARISGESQLRTTLDGEIEGALYNQQTPLLCAVHYGRKEMVELLLMHGANVNRKLSYTPLHGACQRNQPTIAKILIDAGADINAKDSRGRTPLHVSCETKAASIAELLIESGADINAGDGSGSTPLHTACGHQDTTIVKLLLLFQADIDIDARNSRDVTPLHVACKQMDGTNAQLLIHAGADVNLRDKDDQSPLHFACYHPESTVAELLVSADAEINARNVFDATPLDRAINYNGPDAIAFERFLRNHGAKRSSELKEEMPAPSGMMDDIMTDLTVGRGEAMSRPNSKAAEEIPKPTLRVGEAMPNRFPSSREAMPYRTPRIEAVIPQRNSDRANEQPTADVIKEMSQRAFGAKERLAEQIPGAEQQTSSQSNRLRRIQKRVLCCGSVE